LDFISLLAYDLHGSWETPSLAHHAPIFKSGKSDKEASSVDSLVKDLLTYGFPPDKVLLGLSTYGRSWRLGSSKKPVQVKGPGVMARFTKIPNMISYFETCRLVLKVNAPDVNRFQVFVNRSDETKVPSVLTEREWIGYDDPQSFKAKVEI
jgi:chitinase